ncbi:hypothetical protein [Microbulbifer sp.]|uniref:hypothetical protein n=1 Tax=Microbulbifer sp. TaxID=1908541 RepID=UPI0025865703|nr:hypothetical protein [Microbulbifer sp.]
MNTNISGLWASKVMDLTEAGDGVPPSAMNLGFLVREAAAALPGALKEADSIKGNISLTPDAREVQAYKHVNNAMARAQENIMGKLEELTEEVELDRKRLAQSERMNDDERSIAAEVRNHLRSLDAADRPGYLRSAADKGHVGVLRAILAAPAEITGLSDLAYSNTRKSLHKLVDPEPLARIDRATEITGHALEFLKSVDKAVGNYKTPRVSMLLEAAAALPSA